MAVYELKLFLPALQPNRLHAHSTRSLIVPSRNHSQPHRVAFPPANGRKSTFGDEDVTFSRQEIRAAEEPI